MLRPSTLKRTLPFVWLGFVLLAVAIGWWQTVKSTSAKSSNQVVPAAPPPASNAPLRIAVASNFLATAQRLAAAFKEQTGVSVQLSSGSTGTLFAQISHGLPYDIFLAADSRRPQKLIETGLAEPDSATTYAEGQLLYWSPVTIALSSTDHTDNTALNACLRPLQDEQIKRLVLANPDTAPYGLASQQAMKRIGLATSTVTTITAENVSQVFRTLASGNADAGFIARSQWETLPPEQRTGCVWALPRQLHDPLTQQAVMLKSATHPAARDFLAFLRSPQAQRLIFQAGYAVE